MDFDWKSIAGAVAPLAPKLGTVLGTTIGGLVLPGIGAGIGGSIGGIAGRAIAASFGVEATPEAVGKAIAEDPQAKEKLQQLEEDRGDEILAAAQVEVERLKQETEQFRIGAADTQSARQANIALGEHGSWQAWAPNILSLLIVIGFFGASWLFLSRPPSMTEATLSIVSLLIGKLSSSFDQVVQYHLGSSAGSRNKDVTLSQMAVTAAAAGKEQTAVREVPKQAVETARKRR